MLPSLNKRAADESDFERTVAKRGRMEPEFSVASTSGRTDSGRNGGKSASTAAFVREHQTSGAR